MMLRQRPQIDVGQRVPVDDEEVFVRKQRERLARSTRRPEYLPLERIANADAEVAAIADLRRDRFRQIVKVQYGVANALS
jgi:hypothetical protein